MARYQILEGARNNPFPGPGGAGCYDNQQQAFVPWYVCGGLGNNVTNSIINRTLLRKAKGSGCSCKHK